MNQELFKDIDRKYKAIMDSNDSRKIWSSINWKGDMKQSTPHNHPPIEELSEHFASLYEPIEGDDDIESLHSDVYVPATDDPITTTEMNKASKQIKKGGYDFPVVCLDLLLSTIGPVMLLLMNTILLSRFPIRLCLSLLSAIPKLGNLRLPDNYRGIQMLPLLANLYDRIAGNRILSWATISDEQTAFQKKKGSVDQIFLLRMIISMIKAYTPKTALYIGFFDLSKAFDRVSRYLLLKQLLKLGIGGVMFYSLKSTYAVTRVVLRGFGKLSDVFQTHTGIKQGASSSVILFILFLDDIIEYLRNDCLIEPVLNDLHCLLHADDTLIISTNREQFIHKCNLLVGILREKKMSLNLKKSGFMIINGLKDDLKCAIKLNSGWLKYKKEQKYLGAIFSDTGDVKHDVALFLEKKKKEVNVKLASFLNKNKYAPICVKLKTVDACINSALTYSCEAWGSTPLNSVEVLQRKALKMILDVNRNTPNEILYTETGHKTLKPMIYKRQLKFYQKMKDDAERKPNSSISRLFMLAVNTNTTFLRHYKKLDEQFATPQECFKHHVDLQKSEILQKVHMKYESDADSLLGTYKRINPTMQQPTYYRNIECYERDRKIISKYRTGSHKLKVQTGRLAGSVRGDRLCECQTAVQTLEHVLLTCPLSENIREVHNIVCDDLESFFEGNDLSYIATILKAIDNRFTV